MFITEGAQDAPLSQKAPQQDLFLPSPTGKKEQQNDLERKQDLLAVTQLKIRNLKRTLITVPIGDMQKIMEINDKIRILESEIQTLSEELFKKAG